MNTRKSAVRHTIRQQRCALSEKQQTEHAIAVADIFFQHATLSKHKHVALYLANRGELHTTPLIQRLVNHHKTLYLPVLHPERHGELVFQLYTTDMPLIKNKYGILEPAYTANKIKPTQQLDLVLLPLVAFDKQGQRIGMGGGYYDRSLANINKSSQQPSPLLIGLAHEFQRIPHIQAEPWDIKLHGIITEAGYTDTAT